MVQIAGVVARRIVCRVGSGDKLAAGERFGMIRFGSRTDCYMPRGTEVHGAGGRARSRGGQTVHRGADGDRSRRGRAPAAAAVAASCATGARQGIFLFPSLLTTGNLFCGFFALLLTVDHRYAEAALAIFVAMVMDLLDGRVARLMKATSQFGVEFDSLADVVSFCVAPAFLLYSFALHPLGRAAWFGAFLFVICGALRLARFNVQTGTRRPALLRRAVDAGRGRGGGVHRHPAAGRGAGPRRCGSASRSATYVLALLMVSTFRYWTFKEIDFARRRPVRDAAGRRAGGDDRGHHARGLPVPRLRRLRVLGTGAPAGRRPLARTRAHRRAGGKDAH